MTTKTAHVAAMTDDELDAYADVVASDDYDPVVVEVDDLRDLRAVADAGAAVQAADAQLVEVVALARAHGRSWTRIGVALGVSRQAVRQRFGQLVDH